MYLQGINANIMSLGGIAIAIGAMVDAAIVMVENVHRHLELERGRLPHWQVITRAATEVGPTLFLALLVITVSFGPIFALQAQEGRLFRPLAVHQDLFHGGGGAAVDHARAGAGRLLDSRPRPAGGSEPADAGAAGHLSAAAAPPAGVALAGRRRDGGRAGGYRRAGRAPWLGVHAAAVGGRSALYADNPPGCVDRQGARDPAADRSDPADVSGSRPGVRQGRARGHGHRPPRR